MMVIMILAAILITLREGIEIALIVSIILVYLRKTGQTGLNRVVLYGGLAAAGISLILAGALNFVWSSLEEEFLAAFEGTLVIVAAVLLTTMIVWMWNSGKRASLEIEESVEKTIKSREKLTLFALVMVLILREGVELVLFTMVLVFQNGAITYIGAAIGLTIAMAIGIALYKKSFHIPLRPFFKWTSILLIFFAAGMVAYGVHELQEAGIITIGTTELWNLNPPQLPDGSYPLFHENGLIGGIAKSILGYNGNPSLIEIIAYWSYLGIITMYYTIRSRSTPKETITDKQAPRAEHLVN